jgi:hypothetical protein
VVLNFDDEQGKVMGNNQALFYLSAALTPAMGAALSSYKSNANILMCAFLALAAVIWVSWRLPPTMYIVLLDPPKARVFSDATALKVGHGDMVYGRRKDEREEGVLLAAFSADEYNASDSAGTGLGASSSGVVARELYLDSIDFENDNFHGLDTESEHGLDFSGGGERF